MNKFMVLAVLLSMVYVPLSCQQSENTSMRILLNSKLESLGRQELVQLQEILKNYAYYNLATTEFTIDRDSGNEKKIAIAKSEKKFLRRRFEALAASNDKAFKECQNCRDFMQVLENVHRQFDENPLVANPKSSTVVNYVTLNPEKSVIALFPSEKEKKSAEFTRLLLKESQEAVQEMLQKK